ncbi:hypothetical protein DC429_03640 [Arthrobacter sp. TPD3018]|jgi:hypothetical protein|uniref:hypothetical protein n=1 Tax=Bacteria TaxID=2 RepID=UPI000D520311|nr:MULTISPECIES: hypothetical protein [Bacteria]PVE59504.1 hypothetical protein DC425_03635 [Sphingomonas sp. TPD3009]PVE61024.1 hypothetical protein DC429_03640 [Arthrobacter sp. TPD3018]PVE86061.1 hypothetical protein DC431_09540 [Sphingomonas melonis]RTL22724.1 MAG: hypothetical protein EKK50_01415 [Sphingomonadaceae bacterium]
MSDTDLNPVIDGDTVSNTAGDAADAATSRVDQAKQTAKDYTAKYGAQATDKIRTLADTGKERAIGGLDQLSQMIQDAAGQVDDKLGAQYGDYARSAAGVVSNFSGQIRDKDVEELLEDARAFVRKSPGVAIGVAAALGFALARVVQSGLDDKA